MRFEEVSSREKAEAFRSVFGIPGAMSREQQIVYWELCEQFQFHPAFVLVAGGGHIDTHLAAMRSKETEFAKTIYDLLTVPLHLLEGPEPTVTRKPDHVDG